MLSRCYKYGITLNAEKFVVAVPILNFCGYSLSSDGISSDEDKTDASCLYGTGYAPPQDHGQGRMRHIQCGSRSLADAETHYATIELELLVAV
ncbi:hypothetical protein SK128_005479 [Halocaridina rubra]|uniref:Reverse transcriptase RNase H-like domain-containing protein n=1 Tax=Halocaridina rubra TaxID=373956 RepID=A0AAN8WSA6_HALRR